MLCAGPLRMSRAVKRHTLLDVLEDTLLENEAFRDAFCHECPDGVRATRRGEECPAGWSPCEPECMRNNRWRDLSERLKEAVQSYDN